MKYLYEIVVLIIERERTAGASRYSPCPRLGDWFVVGKSIAKSVQVDHGLFERLAAVAGSMSRDARKCGVERCVPEGLLIATGEYVAPESEGELGDDGAVWSVSSACVVSCVAKCLLCAGVPPVTASG